MKWLNIFFTFFLLLSYQKSFATSDNPNEILEEMIKDINYILGKFENKSKTYSLRIKEINYGLTSNISLANKVKLLIEKDKIKEDQNELKLDTQSEITKVRYIKGLQIIKILYEKVLGLDHHFASVRTFSEINKIANPNQYTDFEKLKGIVKQKKDKKQGIDLTQILNGNPLVSVVNTFTNMVVSSMTKEEKEEGLQNIECILDFTLRMQNDLNTIYFETAFLSRANETNKADIEILFKDYTKPIGYDKPLEVCRNQDDWDKVLKLLNDNLKILFEADSKDKRKLQIELSFPIDRLIVYITQYNNFINEGEKFYQKFNIILSSYENESQCNSKLPHEYKKLKQDIDVAIDKFNIAYKPVEVNGSKMKEILYGINEFH
jgi:hypothetical protein